MAGNSPAHGRGYKLLIIPQVFHFACNLYAGAAN